MAAIMALFLGITTYLIFGLSAPSLFSGAPVVPASCA
jgi:hypothetical protein